MCVSVMCYSEQVSRRRSWDPTGGMRCLVEGMVVYKQPAGVPVTHFPTATRSSASGEKEKKNNNLKPANEALPYRPKKKEKKEYWNFFSFSLFHTHTHKRRATQYVFLVTSNLLLRIGRRGNSNNKKT